MKTAAAYIRVSTDKQTELSPDSQLKEIRGFAKRSNILLLENHIYRDEGISGRDVKHRGAFLDMINDAKKKPAPFDIVLVWKFSRFARNREDSIVYKTMLKKNGVQVISVSEPLPDDDISSMTEAMIEAMDEYYSKRLSGEVYRGMKEKLSRGLPVSAAPLGYYIENGHYYPSDQAPFVRRIFEEYANGAGLRQIAVKYGNLGLRTTRGNMPDNRFIEYMLRNPVYIGKIRWCTNGRGASKRDYDNANNMIVDGVHESIISTELFNKVQQRLQLVKNMYRKYQRPEQAKSYMLKGLLRCSACGATLTMLSTECPSLQCHNYGRGACRVSHSLSIAKANAAVITELQSALINSDIILAPGSKAKSNDGIINISKIISNEKMKLKRLSDGYLNGAFDIDEFKQKKSEITSYIDSLETKQKSQKAEPPRFNLPPKARNVLSVIQSQNQSEQAKNEMLRSILAKVIYDKAKSQLILFFYL